MQAKLIVTGGKTNKKEVSLNVPLVVGRSRGAGLTVAHPMVSRQHCEIFESDGLLRIRDLRSTNGTYVCGKRIDEAVLRPHEQFTIGPLTFEVDYEYSGEATLADVNREQRAAAAPDSAVRAEALAASDEPADQAAFVPSTLQPADDAFDFLADLSSTPQPGPSAEVQQAPEDDAVASPEQSAEDLGSPAGLVDGLLRADEDFAPFENPALPEEAEPAAPPIEESAAAQVEPASPIETIGAAPAETVAPDATELGVEAAEPLEIPAPDWDDLPSASEAAWDAAEDVPQVGQSAAPFPEAVLTAAPDDASEASPAPPAIAPIDGEVPDFGAWSDAAPPTAQEEQTEPPFESFREETVAESPGFEAISEGGFGGSSVPVAPSAPAKPKKGWWPFTRNKAAGKSPQTPAKSAAPPDVKALDSKSPGARQPLREEAAESGVPTPEPSRGVPASNGPHGDPQSDLDEFLSGLQ